jgi:cyclic beta-1,2-glucan synthetase
MYRAGVEGILGIRREGTFLVIEPRIPSQWPGYEAAITVDGAGYGVEVVRQSTCGNGVSQATLDGIALPVRSGQVRVPVDGAQHALRLVI